ncbi:PREDICTED: dual specificity [Prunus dulcis]|nr:hypothetical protein L3X38_045307 [Prunus dulcis]VVA14145.1 PREDICTED: dual specificity [Prunus dulcis]
MLQQHSILKTIKKKLIRKALDMIRKLAEEDPDESNDKDEKGQLRRPIIQESAIKNAEPENILVKSYSRCEVKVIDLGSSSFETDYLCSYVQSRSYHAPEVILRLAYDKKIDTWSLGCILAVLCTGNHVVVILILFSCLVFLFSFGE